MDNGLMNHDAWQLTREVASIPIPLYPRMTNIIQCILECLCLSTESPLTQDPTQCYGFTIQDIQPHPRIFPLLHTLLAELLCYKQCCRRNICCEPGLAQWQCIQTSKQLNKKKSTNKNLDHFQWWWNGLSQILASNSKH